MTWEEWVGASYNTAYQKYGIALANYDSVSADYMAYRYCEDGYFSYQLLKIYNNNYGTYKTDKIVNGISYIIDKPSGALEPCKK